MPVPVRLDIPTRGLGGTQHRRPVRSHRDWVQSPDVGSLSTQPSTPVRVAGGGRQSRPVRPRRSSAILSQGMRIIDNIKELLGDDLKADSENCVVTRRNGIYDQRNPPAPAPRSSPCPQRARNSGSQGSRGATLVTSHQQQQVPGPGTKHQVTWLVGVSSGYSRGPSRM